MVTVLLVRHGRSTSNAAGTLAGRTPGVDLDDHGRTQAAALAGRLSGIPIHRLVCSPMDRCRQTVAPLAAALGLEVETDDRLLEVDYGSWSGRELKALLHEPLWRVVQAHPSAAVFPDGEGLAEMSARAVDGIRAIRRAATADTTVLVCSHGDVIKAILADALGLHLDSFQRIVVAPASVSVVRYTPLRPFVERVNDTGDPILAPPPARPAPADPAAESGAGNSAGAAGAAGEQPGGPSGDGAAHPSADHSSDAVPGGVTR
ncbi:MSMEG_4193 family putative phosphomutase [Nakamurella sp.]|uniref:MSMEG_4193 family putative phosphomutase n=1 Tax=Nakamurella sp. TaxID=1869182 RepID=UPI003B3A4847